MKPTAYSYDFGRETVCYGEDDWRYADTLAQVPERASHPCRLCGENQCANGHDPCISELPGVKFACCGHGVSQGYVMFENGLVLRGQFDHMACALRRNGGPQ